MRNSLRFRRLAWLLVIAALSPTNGFAGELPAEAKILDDKTVMYMRPVPLVSPDGRLVAYVSRGYVCVADIEAGKTRRLVEVPHTWSHYFASLEGSSEGGDAETLPKLLSSDWPKRLQAHVKAEISDFQWTIQSDAVIFRVHSHDADKQSTTVHVWRAPLEVEAKVIASTEHVLTSHRGPGGVLTRDGRYLVANRGGRERALIWDVATNKPRATPYLYMTPSSTSGCWLSVEKDSRQLVLLNEDFKVSERFAEILPDARYGFDMIWSPDERFVFWRQQIGFDYYSNWVGCRYDLRTGQREIFTGDYMGEKIVFTGNRSEVLRVGKAGVQRHFAGLDEMERYVGVIPEGSPYLRRFFQLRADAQGTVRERGLGGIAPVIWSPDFELFILGLPRQEGPHGEVLHLADRRRQLWNLPGGETDRYISPYNVAGFALDGRVIIAYDSTRLFVLPVTAIQTSENKVR